MLRNFLSWNRSGGTNRQKRRRAGRQTRRYQPLGAVNLGVEHLESRHVLSANPVLTVVSDQFVNEGTPLNLPDIGTFTDVVEGSGTGGDAIGLDPMAFTSLGAFDPTSNVTINTSLAIPELTWGSTTLLGTTVMADVGHGSFEIAVFAFSDFELDSGITLTGRGSRPLAILSQSDITVGGTIDVSAWKDPLDLSVNAPFNFAGAGGGAGGDATSPIHGEPAAGAPILGGGQLNGTGGPSGTGGGFGGVGGIGQRSTGVAGLSVGPGGSAYGDLADAIQGGSGGSKSGVNSVGGPPGGTPVFGGGGGGGIELGAVNTVSILVSGQILADGGRGQSIAMGSSATGGGGGAGGGILLHGMDVAQAGLLSAKGGNGGARQSTGAASGGGGGGGRIMLVHGIGGLITNTGTANVSGGTVGVGSTFSQPGAVGNVTELEQPETTTPVIETFDYVIDWDDGSTDGGDATIDSPGTAVGDTVAGSFDGSHTYADNGVYLVTVTITDNNGGTSTETFYVTVNNVAPSLAISGSSDVDEGDNYTLNLASNDPGTDTIASWEINWGDSVETVSGNPASVSHTYADGDASHTISATATDEDGTFVTGNTVVVAVHNVAPALTIAGASDVNEGSIYTLSLSPSDPGADTISSWEITWGDGNVETVLGNPSTVTHTYADGLNNWTISATATDEDGTFAAGNTVAVAVLNVLPLLALAGAASVNEGSSYSLNLSSSDPGADTITSWTINWGDGIEVVSGNPASVSHTYADGDNNYTISATATDEDGTYAAGNTVAVIVLNVAPTANAGGPYQTFDDTPITLHGTGTDPAGALDPLTFSWDLDNNGTFETLGADATFDPVALGFSGTVTRTVQLRVSDGDGGLTTTTTTVQLLGEGTLLIDNVLYVVGNNTACDIVLITQVSSTVQVYATFNSSNPASFNAADVNEIQVRTRGGHDIVVTTPNVIKLMTIDGGSGNDLLTGGGGRNLIIGGTGRDILYGSSGDDVLLGGDGSDDLIGGSGNDVLVGGNGNDILRGGAGRDLIIGSQDNDLLDGGGDEDILIGGYTIHDNNVAALDAVMAIWGSGASFSSRVATLTTSGGLLQAGVAVFDDDDGDILIGGAGRDLVFGDNNPWDGAIDLIALQPLQDVLVAVT